MVTKEKLTWLKKNLRRGDKKKIRDLLPSLEYVTIVAVLNGLFYGEHGELITDTAEKFLNDRIKKEAVEKKHYSSLLEESTI